MHRSRLCPLVACALSILSLAGMPAAALAQGALTPSGPPGPTMRALHEIETRTPVQSLGGDATAQYLITAPGAYYLTGDIAGVSGKSAIVIQADGVTLDLGGHLVTGTTGALRGIEFRGPRTGFAIRQGVIRNFDQGGVAANGAAVTQGHLAGLVVRSCSPGIAFTGAPADGVTISDCTVTGGTADGIVLTPASGLVERCAVSGLTGAAAVSGIVAGVVNHCTVTSLTATGGSAVQGIACTEASRCTVSAVTNSGSGSASGITGSVVTGCDVQSVSASAAAAVGIAASTTSECAVATVSVAGGTSSCTGINSTNTSGCRVTSIGSAAGSAGTPVGISATTVSGCSVTSVGNAASLGTAVGITAKNVQHCTVQTIGVVTSTVGATGVTTNLAAHVFVNGVRGGSTGNALGLGATEAMHCRVQAVSATGGSGNATGIQGDIIADVNVSDIFANSTGNSAGLRSYSVCRNSSSTQIVAASGPAYGALTFANGRTENVMVQGSAITTGIAVDSSHTVIGCSILQATTGISATSTRNIIDGNSIGPCTTGISVRNGSNTASALIVRNQIRGTTTKIVNDTPCQVGPVVSASGTIASTNPWANFTD
ncbi:MAG: hypothetical protein JSR82_12735 [Verrucomicrobia bacterium]|nr:hypothetical protein [Verrucomicrobiota bacterium]